MNDLPIIPYLDRIAEALFSSPSRFLVLTAETAAGKSTEVPQAFLNRLRGNIIMLEPRRLATVAIAERIAQRLGEMCGKTVGYRMKYESKVSASTRIEIITEAILARRIQNDPALEGISLVILDEFHERSIHSDFALALLQDLMQIRDDLYVIVMSATIDSARLGEFLNAKTIHVSGRQWPVHITHAPIPRDLAPDRFGMEKHCCSVIEAEIAREESLSILVFLPGLAEIRRVESLLKSRVSAEIFILHGSVPFSSQCGVFDPPREGESRVILSSSIAETSITVPSVTLVIDSGLRRSAELNPSTYMSRLVTGPESVFSAGQRAGRAGRTGPGRCIRLWSINDPRISESKPEILTSDLSGLVLDCASWGVFSRTALRWLDPPGEAQWNAAVELLKLMDALDSSGKITVKGKRMSALGVHPRIAATALSGGIDEAVLHSPEQQSPDEKKRMALELERKIREGGGFLRDRDTGEFLPHSLLSGFPDRLALHVGEGKYQFPSGRIAALDKFSREESNSFSRWIIATSVDGGEREGIIQQWAEIDDASAERFAAERGSQNETITAYFNPSDASGFFQFKLEKKEITAYKKIVLKERRLEVSDSEYVRVFCDAVRKEGLGVLPWNESSLSFLERARFRKRKVTGAPDCSDEFLLESLDDWLPGFIDPSGKHPVTPESLLAALRYACDGRAVDRDVSERILLPNGKEKRVVYEELVSGEGVVPILEERIQELYGCARMPTILGERILLRLLSPARRPVQITSDLEGFWKSSWKEVRKEMKGRYPKHDWPENPA